MEGTGRTIADLCARAEARGVRAAGGGHHGLTTASSTRDAAAAVRRCGKADYLIRPYFRIAAIMRSTGIA